MRVNRTLNLLRQGETVLGCALQVYRSSEIPRVFAAAGYDFVFIDLEHGSFGLETAHDLITSSVKAGITPIVRVGELLYSLAARMLDAGAQGIILPRVEDPKLLEEALSWLRYPPQGQRGYGINPTMLDYEAASFADAMEHANCSTLAVAQFETAAAVERADELLSVKGLDVVMVGPADLSVSLGIPGEFDHPRMVAALERIIERCQTHHVVPGIHFANAELARTWRARGMRFVSCGAEHELLFAKARESVRFLRG